MEATDQSVTDYFLYVKNVLGVKTLQSSSLASEAGLAEAPLAQNEPGQPVSRGTRAPAAQAVQSCDLLFLNIRTKKEETIFSSEIKALTDKMIQAMRLGNRKVLIEEVDVGSELKGTDSEVTEILQTVAKRIQSSFVVLYSAKPGTQGVVQNLGRQKYIETFSPAYLIERPQAKKVVWLDLQKVMKELGVS